MRQVTKKWLALATSIAVMTSSSAQAGISACAYTTADKYVEEAKEHDYIEGRPNEVTDYWGVVGEWCAMYVYYIAVQCGIGDQIGRYSYCDNLYGYNGFRNVYEKNGKFAYRGDYIPQKGDLILFDWGYDGYCDHIGIVLGADTSKWQVYTIEGNVNDKVAYKTYSLSSNNIVGYCQTGLNVQTEDSGNGAQQPTDSTVDTSGDIQYNNTVSRFKLTSPIGGWLRQSANYGMKIGIVSTGTVLDAILNKSDGDWIYVQDVPTENGLTSDGYVYKGNIELIEEPGMPDNTDGTIGKDTTDNVDSTVNDGTDSGVDNGNNGQDDGYIRTANYYISSTIGANARTSAEFGNNIKKVLNTNTKVYVESWTNGFAHCQVVNTGEWVYLHNTVIDKLQQENDANINTETETENKTPEIDDNGSVSNPAIEPTHYVSSPIGCNMRAIGSYSGKLVRILDTYQKIKVLENKNSIGYVYCEADVPGVGIVKGYVINTAITKLQ